MRFLGIIVMTSVGLAVAAAVAKLIVLAIVLAAFVAILTRPKEMLSLVATLGVLNLFALHPGMMLAIAGTGLALRILRYKQVGGQSRQANGYLSASGSDD